MNYVQSPKILPVAKVSFKGSESNNEFSEHPRTQKHTHTMRERERDLAQFFHVLTTNVSSKGSIMNRSWSSLGGKVRATGFMSV